MSFSKTLYPLLSTGSTQESRHDWKIIDWHIKHQSHTKKHLYFLRNHSDTSVDDMEKSPQNSVQKPYIVFLKSLQHLYVGIYIIYWFLSHLL